MRVQHTRYAGISRWSQDLPSTSARALPRLLRLRTYVLYGNSRDQPCYAAPQLYAGWLPRVLLYQTAENVVQCNLPRQGTSARSHFYYWRQIGKIHGKNVHINCDKWHAVKSCTSIHYNNNYNGFITIIMCSCRNLQVIATDSYCVIHASMQHCLYVHCGIWVHLDFILFLP